ncbi:hypothetical protein NL676_023958 [Syzygium grande]|nr:hypothetical protein NL676_023958 [Syzygium grande]
MRCLHGHGRWIHPLFGGPHDQDSRETDGSDWRTLSVSNGLGSRRQLAAFHVDRSDCVYRAATLQLHVEPSTPISRFWAFQPTGFLSGGSGPLEAT